MLGSQQPRLPVKKSIIFMMDFFTLATKTFFLLNFRRDKRNFQY